MVGGGPAEGIVEGGGEVEVEVVEEVGPEGHVTGPTSYSGWK